MLFHFLYVFVALAAWSCTDATPIHSYPEHRAGDLLYANRDSAGNGHNLKVVCYYGTWAVYRPGDGKFPVENIDPFLCTHLIYAFAGLSYDNRIKPLDPWNDLEANYGKGAMKRFNNLKKINPNLKTIIAIGGWNEGSIKYSAMAASAESRRVFVASCVEFIAKYGFDGLDMDWEYPASRGGKPEDKQNFVTLLRELKDAFRPQGYLLTSAVSAGKWFIDPAYDIAQVSQHLDIINVMAYDYHGGWENKTGMNAPMYRRPDESFEDRFTNVNFSINYWISKGASKDKIVMGMGTYGRSFTLQRAEDHGLDAPAPQRGQAGPYTREPGSLGYNEICEAQMREKWTIVRDPYHLAPYAYKDRQWVGYDDVESITLKSQFIKAMGLAGGMIWSVETDDFLGKCHNGKKYPLLTAINDVFRSGVTELPTPAPAPERPVTEATEAPSSSSTTRRSWEWTPSSTQSTPSSSASTWWPTSSTTTTSSPSTWWPPASSSSPSSPPSSSASTWWPTSSTTPSTTMDHEREWGSTSTASSTTSRTWEASTPQGGGDGKEQLPCPSEGMHRHPQTCEKFYRCVSNGGEGSGFRVYQYDCPSSTVFDTKSNLCTWRSSVPECNNLVARRSYDSHSHAVDSVPKGRHIDP